MPHQSVAQTLQTKSPTVKPLTPNPRLEHPHCSCQSQLLGHRLTRQGREGSGSPQRHPPPSADHSCSKSQGLLQGSGAKPSPDAPGQRSVTPHTVTRDQLGQRQELPAAALRAQLTGASISCFLSAASAGTRGMLEAFTFAPAGELHRRENPTCPLPALYLTRPPAESWVLSTLVAPGREGRSLGIKANRLFPARSHGCPELL